MLTLCSDEQARWGLVPLSGLHAIREGRQLVSNQTCYYHERELHRKVREDFSEEGTIKQRGIMQVHTEARGICIVCGLAEDQWLKQREEVPKERAKDEVEKRVKLSSSSTRDTSARKEEEGIGWFIGSYHPCSAAIFARLRRMTIRWRHRKSRLSEVKAERPARRARPSFGSEHGQCHFVAWFVLTGPLFTLTSGPTDRKLSTEKQVNSKLFAQVVTTMEQADLANFFPNVHHMFGRTKRATLAPSGQEPGTGSHVLAAEKWLT